MVFKTGDINDMLDFARGKKLVCFGEVSELEYLCELFSSHNLREHIDSVVGTPLRFAKQSAGMASLQDTMYRVPTVLLFVRLEMFIDFYSSPAYGLFGDTAFYVGDFLIHTPPSYCLPEYSPEKGKPLIPKILHYCWFGGNPLHPLHVKCVESWKKFCPDYEIIEWNEKNYDVTKNPYMYEAYKAEKWAFVSDYARLDAVYNYGGIYVDADVELVKPLDRFLCDTAFCGVDNPGCAALGPPFGAVPNHDFIGSLRDMYNNISFIKDDGSLNLLPNTSYHERIFRRLGLTVENKTQRIYGMTVYPTDVFSPLHPKLAIESYTENTHAIHHFAWTWGADGEVRHKCLVVKRARELLASLHECNPYKVPFDRS